MPATTAAGTVMVEQTVVRMVLGVALSLQEFTVDKQTLFKRALAAAAGVGAESVRITNISSRSPTRRRLLAGGISVSAQATVAGAAQGASAAQQLTAANLNAQMGQLGLPAVEVLQAPVVAVVQVAVVPGRTTRAPAATPAPSLPIRASVQLSVALGRGADGGRAGGRRRHAALWVAIACAAAAAVVFIVVCVVVFLRVAAARRRAASAGTGCYYYHNVACAHCEYVRAVHAQM